MRKTVTWIVLADAAEARILANDGPGKGLYEVPRGRLHGTKQANREIMADRPGRTFDRAGQGRHSMEPRHSAKQVSQEAFLAGVARRLERAVAAGHYDRLILVAAPKALGGLRKHLSRQVIDRISAEMPKDLIQVATADLARHLAPVLPA